MKMAVQYWLNRGVSGRTRFLAFRGGYHGDTLGAMAVCDPEEGMHRLFAGVLPAQHRRRPAARRRRERRRSTAFLAQHAHEIAAVIVEPLVQGAGGMLFHDAAVLRRLRGSPTRTACC